MGIIYIYLLKYSLIYELVENGFGDLKVIVENKEFLTVKSIFCGNNEIFTTLVNDTKFPGYLELYDGCSEIGFRCLEKYYGNGKVVIDESNCIDILSICAYYDEEKLLKECGKYSFLYY